MIDTMCHRWILDEREINTPDWHSGSINECQNNFSFLKWRHISKQGSEGVINVQSKTKPINTFLFSPSQNITYLMKKLVHNWPKNTPIHCLKTFQKLLTLIAMTMF
jgi:hypothetical protein